MQKHRTFESSSIIPLRLDLNPNLILISCILKQEERQSLLLERIIKNVDLLNESLLDLDRSVAEINAHNSSITIVAELWEGVSIQDRRQDSAGARAGSP